MLFKIAVRIVVSIVLFIGLAWAFLSALIFPFEGPIDTIDDIHIGKDALRFIRLTLPASARGLYAMDGGNWNGSIDYWAFSCGSVDEARR